MTNYVFYYQNRMVVLPWKKIALPIYGMFKQDNDTWGWNGGCWWGMKPEKILIVVLAIMSQRSKWPATSCHQAHERGLFPSLIQLWDSTTQVKKDDISELQLSLQSSNSRMVMGSMGCNGVIRSPQPSWPSSLLSRRPVASGIASSWMGDHDDHVFQTRGRADL